MDRKKLGKILWVVFVCWLMVGCIYQGNFGPVTDKYVVLYGKEDWQKDTGWPESKIATMKIPLWNNPPEESRQPIAFLSIGSKALVLYNTSNSYQIIHPDTGEVGWLDKEYVKTTILKPKYPEEEYKTEVAQGAFGVYENQNYSKWEPSADATTVSVATTGKTKIISGDPAAEEPSVIIEE